MRIRLVLDNTATLHLPWYRVEKLEGSNWVLVDSGFEASARKVFDRIKQGVPDRVVVEEWESGKLQPMGEPPEGDMEDAPFVGKD